MSSCLCDLNPDCDGGRSRVDRFRVTGGDKRIQRVTRDEMKRSTSSSGDCQQPTYHPIDQRSDGLRGM